MSEVARLRRQLELECEAIRFVMEGFAITAKHKFINKRYENLGKCQEELEKHVGKEEAICIVVETYSKVLG